VSFVDGVNERSTTMDYELVQPIISPHNSSLFLGHSQSVTQQMPSILHCQLGNIFLFNGYVLLHYNINLLVEILASGISP